MSMAHALEVRAPFLDHELVEFVLGVNDQHKFPHTPKQLLVDSLGDLLPREIVDRPKMGFTLLVGAVDEERTEVLLRGAPHQARPA